MQRFVEHTEDEIAQRVSARDVDGFFAVMKAVGELTGVTVRPQRKDQSLRPGPRRR